jgi:predicted ATPase
MPDIQHTEAPVNSVNEQNSMNELAADAYRRHLDQIDTAIADARKVDGTYGFFRVAAFFAALIFLIIGYTSKAVPASSWIGWVLLMVFLGVVIANEPTRLKMEADRRRREVLIRLIARTQRDWKRLESIGDPADPTSELDESSRAVATDLDLFGTTSLYRFVSVAGTTMGVREIARWISQPAPASESMDRADAARRLVAEREARLNFYEQTRIIGASTGSPDAFVKWASGPAWLAKHAWLKTWSIASGVIACIGILLLIFGKVIATINLLISMFGLSSMHEIFSIAMANRSSVSRVSKLLGGHWWVQHAGDNRLLARLRSNLIDGEQSAQAGMTQLENIARAGSLRSSAATYLIYLPLQLFGLYDVWVLDRLEKWQAKYRQSVGQWFAALGELEAVSSIAAVRDEQSHWTTAQFLSPLDKTATVSGQSIGHPLLSDQVRVCNDVRIGPQGTLLLVTGSNMSGKSTMLRSVGLNVALATAGGPVCARQFSLPPVEMMTSIRVTDDLSQGVSFYMAELKRLKQVVDRAKKLQTQADSIGLFLLDEILQGTNSRERQIAVARVLESLIDAGSIGAITTHDLELADDKKLMSRSETVHFRETIRRGQDGNDEMTFDYKMHPGICPTTNAIKLLEMVGL